jgi:uncharacterized membrane protein
VRRHRLHGEDDACARRGFFDPASHLRYAHVADQDEPRGLAKHHGLANGRAQCLTEKVEWRRPGVAFALELAVQSDHLAAHLNERLARHRDDLLAARGNHQSACNAVFRELEAEHRRQLIQGHRLRGP